MEPLATPVETITPEVMHKCVTPLSDEHDEKYGVPSLEELGVLERRLTGPGEAGVGASSAWLCVGHQCFVFLLFFFPTRGG